MALVIGKPDQKKPNDQTKWVDIPGYEGVRFKIRPLYNDDYQLAQSKYQEWLNTQVAETTDGTDIDLRIHDYDKRKLPLQAEMLARHVITDWEGVSTSEEGETVPYEIDLATELLTGNLKVFNTVVDQAKAYSLDLYAEKGKTRKKR